MGSTSIAVALALAALASLALEFRRASAASEGPQRRSGARSALLAFAAVGAIVAHLGLLDRDRETREFHAAIPPVHVHEFFHYFLGTKYFAEVGHDRLYEATVIADLEAQPQAFRPRNLFRNLRTNQVDRIRGDVIDEGKLAKQAFRAVRWEEFASDLSLLRDAVPSSRAWHSSGILRDHGYNGTPLTTALLGTLGNQPFLDTYSFIQTVRWVDLLLLAGTIAGLAALFGSTTALVFTVLFFANPLNDAAFIGSCYLRYSFVLCLIGAWACLERGHRVGAGVLLAAASHFRVFPALFAAGLLLWDLAQPDRKRRLREDVPLFASYAAAGLLIALATAGVQDPDGRSVWLAFGERLFTHSGAYAFNGSGLTALFVYVPGLETGLLERAVAAGEVRNYEDLMQQTLASRALPRWLAVAALLAATVACARRLPRSAALFLGFPLIFGFLYLTHYYYCWLGLLALVFRNDRPVLLTLTACTALLLACAVPTAFATPDARYAAASGVLLVTLISVGVIAARPRASGGPRENSA